MSVVLQNLAEIAAEKAVMAVAPIVGPIKDSFNFSVSESAIVGDTVHVPGYSAGTATRFNTSSNHYGTTGSSGDSFVPVTILDPLKETIALTPKVLARTDINKWVRTAIMACAKGMAAEVHSTIESGFAAAGFKCATAFVASLTNLAKLQDLRNQAVTKGLDITELRAWLSPTSHTTLMSDAGVASAAALGSSEVIRGGTTRNLEGYTIDMSNFFAAPGAAASGISHGYIFDPSCLTIVHAPNAYNADPAGTTEFESVIDPTTGLSFLLSKYWEPQQRCWMLTVEIAYGIAKSSDRLIRVVA